MSSIAEAEFKIKSNFKPKLKSKRSLSSSDESYDSKSNESKESSEGAG